MAKLVAYIGFAGKAKEAMEFYKSVFGGELFMQTIGESPMASMSSPEDQGKILHSDLTTPTLRIMGSDQNDPATLIKNDLISLCLMAETEEELQSLWNKLMEGGTPEHPLKKEFFGWFGDGRDKYNVRWMFQMDLPKA